MYLVVESVNRHGVLSCRLPAVDGAVLPDETVHIDILHALRDVEFSQRRGYEVIKFVLRRLKELQRFMVESHDVVQAFASLEYVGIDDFLHFVALFQYDMIELVASIEVTVSVCIDTAWDGDALQTLAVLEAILVKERDGLWQNDALERSATVESLLFYGADVQALIAVDRLQSGAALETLHTYFPDGTRQCDGNKSGAALKTLISKLDHPVCLTLNRDFARHGYIAFEIASGETCLAIREVYGVFPSIDSDVIDDVCHYICGACHPHQRGKQRE